MPPIHRYGHYGASPTWGQNALPSCRLYSAWLMQRCCFECVREQCAASFLSAIGRTALAGRPGKVPDRFIKGEIALGALAASC